MNRIHRCIQALEKGEVKKALQIIREVADEGNDEEMYALAEQLESLGFQEEIIPLYERLLEHHPDEGEFLTSLAEIYVNIGKEEEAFLTLEKIKKEDPHYVQALLIQADLYQSEGLYEVSEQKLLEAERMAPEEPVIQFALAEFYNAVGKFDQAVYKYEKLLKDYPEFAGINLYERLADIYSEAGEFEKALPYFEKALENKWTVDTLFAYGLTLYQLKRYEPAIGRFEEVKGLDPEYSSVYLPLAKAYDHMGDLKRAIDTAEEGVVKNPYQKELPHLAGTLHRKQGDDAKAEEWFRKALDIDPEYEEALLSLSRLLLDQERYAEVVELLSGVAEEEADPELLYMYAVACQQEEKYSEALNSYQNAYKYGKNDEDFLRQYAFFLLEAGKQTEAIEIFKQLNKLDPANPDYLDVLGRFQSDGV
jgi:Tetratricopeptide repeat.